MKLLRKNDQNEPLTEDLLLHISLGKFEGCIDHSFEASESKTLTFESFLFVFVEFFLQKLIEIFSLR